jgi:riboflavin biosynthesis pyrimidine reductase
VTEALQPLELLYEAEGLPSFDVPDDLAATYGGTFGLREPSLVVNFVATLDGVVAIPALQNSPRAISDANMADRFVMGLLRASASAVLIGAGTLRDSRVSLWRPDQVYPPAAASFAEFRRRLGRSERPEVAVLSATGDIEPRHPLLEAGALVLTTELGATSLRGRLPEASSLAVLPGEDSVDLPEAVALLRERGHALVLSEAGPAVTGSLLDAGLVDELFLTLSPLLAGRAPESERFGLVEGVVLIPEARVGGQLLGVRRHGAHLFLRYGIDRVARFEPAATRP